MCPVNAGSCVACNLFVADCLVAVLCSQKKREGNRRQDDYDLKARRGTNCIHGDTVVVFIVVK